MNKIVEYALGVAAATLVISSTLFTLNWTSCLSHKGGKACEAALSRAGDEWKNFGMTSLALAINIIRNQQQAPSP